MALCMRMYLSGVFHALDDADDIIVTCIMWYQHVIRRARQIRAAFDRFVLLSVSMLVFNHVVGGVMGGETMAHWETNAYSTAPF
jgi:hypothetical protein